MEKEPVLFIDDKGIAENLNNKTQMNDNAQPLIKTTIPLKKRQAHPIFPEMGLLPDLKTESGKSGVLECNIKLLCPVYSDMQGFVMQ